MLNNQHCESAPAPDRPARARLTAPQLLALQLVARGYSLRQLATLAPTGGSGGVLALLRSAAETLGAATVPAAILEAKRRGLIDD